MAIESTIREAVGQSDKTQTQMGDEAGISQVAVHKFLKRGMSLTGDKLERLAASVGIEIVCKRKKLRAKR
jgi:transcriptional regulator with XRE-family HTH domain